jgi:hypothetical protein
MVETVRVIKIVIIYNNIIVILITGKNKAKDHHRRGHEGPKGE